MPRKKARMTVLEVLSELHKVRLTMAKLAFSTDDTDAVNDLLADLEKKLLLDYGDLRRDTQLQEWKHK